MQPLDFYWLATELTEAASTEAQCRTVISRVYYGLHHECCCRYFRQAKVRPLSTRGRHAELRDRFNEVGNPEAARIAELLGLLLRLRVQADYDIGTPMRLGPAAATPREAMRRALAFARSLLDALDRFSPGESPDGCRCSVVWSTR